MPGFEEWRSPGRTPDRGGGNVDGCVGMAITMAACLVSAVTVAACGIWSIFT
jgi:hypothetical protein